jgi:hypothetical protein
MGHVAAIGAIIATAVGAATGALQTFKQGKAEAAADRYQERVAKNNAILANRAALDALDRGNVEASKVGLKNRQALGAIKAQFAANGLLTDSGTVGDVMGSQNALGMLDELTVKSNAAREAQGHYIEGMNYTAQAKLLHSQARQAEYFSKFAAITTLVTGAASVADKWHNYNPTPATGGGGSPYVTQSSGTGSWTTSGDTYGYKKGPSGFAVGPV